MNTQSASQLGHHNVIVQASGDNICVQVGMPHLTLVSVDKRIRCEPRREIDILNPAFQAAEYIGRDRDLRFLRDWLTSEPSIAAAALVGPGGSGKTRLAQEVLQRLPENWQGGFLTTNEAKRFIEKENVVGWCWQNPTLVIADYAATMAQALARWLAQLADHAVPLHPLRILMLERHADSKEGWYSSLVDATWHGQATRELILPPEPWTITPFDEPGQRRRVLQAGLQSAARLAQPGKTMPELPTPGHDVWFDRRLAEVQWTNPLLLLMAGVIAATDGLNAALKLSRPELAAMLAKRERDRVRNSAQTPADMDLLAHVYACITLCGGVPREQAIRIAEQEFTELRREYLGGPGAAIEDLARSLGEWDTLPPLVPDLVGEALLPITFSESGPKVAARLAQMEPIGVVSTLVRSVQDFGPADERWPLEWLRSVAEAARPNAQILYAIEATIPFETVILREFALKVTQWIVDHVIQDSRDAEVYLAQMWNNLAARQTALGRYEAALASATEELVGAPLLWSSTVIPFSPVWLSR